MSVIGIPLRLNISTDFQSRTSYPAWVNTGDHVYQCCFCLSVCLAVASIESTSSRSIWLYFLSNPWVGPSIWNSVSSCRIISDNRWCWCIFCNLMRNYCHILLLSIENSRACGGTSFGFSPTKNALRLNLAHKIWHGLRWSPHVDYDICHHVWSLGFLLWLP